MVLTVNLPGSVLDQTIALRRSTSSFRVVGTRLLTVMAVKYSLREWMLSLS
jgi:hypothetical protein